MDISFIMYVTNLIFSIHVYDITAEGTVSQIFDIGQKSETVPSGGMLSTCVQNLRLPGILLVEI